MSFRLLCAPLLLLCFAATAFADRGYRSEAMELELEPEVQALIDAFEKAQAETKTMTAHFRQVREDDLFAEAKVLQGDFWFTHPSNFRWEYSDDDAGKVVVLATKDLFQRYIPAWKTLQQKDISKKSRRVFQYFGIGSDIDNLRRRFDIAIGDASDYPGTKKLELRGRWRRVKKRLEVLEMWVDDQRHLPVAVRVVLPDGGSTTWEFSGLTVNPVIPPERYHLDVPDDTKVIEEDKGMTATSEILDDILDEEEDEGAPSDPAPAGR